MSAVEGFFLLLGIFGVPIALLVIGHRFRRLERRMRGAFWGGVAGYAVGVIAWAITAIAPAEMWAQGSLRQFAIVIAPVMFGAAGFVLGALVGNQPKPRRHSHRKAVKALGKHATAREHGST